MRITQQRLNSYQNHYERVLSFLRNVHERGAQLATPDFQQAVWFAIAAILEEPQP